jgi:hypothetical protein
MNWTVKDLMARLSTLDPESEVMVGTAYDNDTELTSDFDVYEAPVTNIEDDFYMETENDGDQDKNVVAIW